VILDIRRNTQSNSNVFLEKSMSAACDGTAITQPTWSSVGGKLKLTSALPETGLNADLREQAEI
jgi:hypothetical protein